MSSLQRRQLILCYLFATKGPLPVVFQTINGRLCQVQLTRHYLEYLSRGEPPYIPEDLISVDTILKMWDREEVSA